LPDSRSARPVSSGSLALTSEGRTLVATNMLNNSISFIEVFTPTAAQLIEEVPVGTDPRSVAVTPDASRVLVTLRGENSLAVVDFQTRDLLTKIDLEGSLPYAVVSDRNDRALVSLQGSNEIVEIDLVNNRVSRRL